MVGKGRHPKNEINAAFSDLDKAVFTVVPDQNSHTWGFVNCDKCGESFRVYGTPQNPGDVAKHIRKWAYRHRH